MEEVLSRPGYREHEPGLIDRGLALLAEALGRLLETILGAGRAGPLGLVALLVLVAVITVLVLRFAAALRRSAVRDAGLAADTGRSPRDWEAEAEDHERAGRWRQALRCRYRFLLASLAQQGLLEEVPGRTSREYLAEARVNLPEAAGDLEAVTAAFERVWYGDQQADEARVREVAGAVARIIDLARGGRRRAAAIPGIGRST